MEEKKEIHDKPFNSYQYEWINGHLVKKEEFQENIKEINEKICVINEISTENTKNLKMLLSGLKWVGGTAGVLVISQMFDFFINLAK